MVDPMAEPEGEEKCADPGGAAGGEGTAEAAAAMALSAAGSADEPSAPAPAEAPPAGDPGKLREESPMLHLDLFNFDRPEAEGSRYVLTSPRSLEACARSAVKPVELLPRPLAELVKEAPGRSMRVAAGLYEVYEMDRQRKLRQCREEREKIIREEKRRLFGPAALGSLPSSPAPRISFKGCTPALPSRAGCPPPAGAKTRKSHSLDSLQKRREGSSNKTSSDSGASSSYSGDSLKDKWPKDLLSPRTAFTMSSLVGRSFSLSDLSHSPQTTKKVEMIVKEVKRRKGLKVVPERDRKIAALMIARHQEESILNAQRYSAHLQWDSQRRRSEQLKEREEREKQRALLQCHRMWETRLQKRRSKLSREQEEVALQKQQQKQVEAQKWQEQVERQGRVRKERLQKATLEDKQKKRHQEHNLKAQEEGRREAAEREAHMLQGKVVVAAQKRVLKEQLQQQKKLLNEAEKQKHKTILKELAKLEAEEKAQLRASVEGSLNKAQDNYEHLVEKRNQELREKAKREEMHSQRARLIAEKREREQKEHLEAMAKASERKQQHATQVAEEVVQQKARKVVQSRMEKEKVQKVNKRKVEQHEDTRRREILLSIEKKLERSEQFFKDKKTVLENARSVARASFHVREKVREEMNTRTFDRMAKEAEMQASLVKK